MNITTNEAGCVSHQHILDSGFKVDRVDEYLDMGQLAYALTDYSKNDKLFLTGGYWTYFIRNKDGVLLWQGWWNSDQEFDKTIIELEEKLY